MQTFLVYPDFYASAEVLDRQRLGKQRVETYQLVNACMYQTKGWSNHPASRMWRGYEFQLVQYGLAVCKEWIGRGYNDTMTGKLTDQIEMYELEDTGLPSWFGDNAFHAAHRSNLLRKDPVWYSQYEWSEPDDLDYVWPV